MQRVLAQAAKVSEGGQVSPHLKAFQDTAVAWVPKTFVSRSKSELSELTFLEFLESLLVYYSAPLAGSYVFKPLLRRVAGKGLDSSWLGKALPEIPASQLKRVLPVKAAMILASVGMTLLAGEYVIIYAKNLLTARVFKKDRFSDVVGLSGGQMKSEADSETVQKARRRIKQCLMLSLGVLGASLGLARFGGGVKFLQKPLEKLVRHFDFALDSKGRYQLGRNQMLALMGLAVPAYLDAARDNLERVETVSRLALVLPYLAFGQEFLQKRLQGPLGRKFPEMLASDGSVKTMETLAADALAAARQKLLGGSTEQLTKLAAEELRRPLRGKNLLFGIPLLVGVLGTGVGVGLLNRFWTAHRYKREQAMQPASTQTAPSLLGNPFNSPLNTQRSAGFDAYLGRVAQRRTAVAFRASATR